MAYPTLSFAFNPDQGETPEMLAYKRSIADQISGKMGHAQNWGDGLGDIFRGIAAGSVRRSADKSEKVALKGEQDLWDKNSWAALNSPFSNSQPSISPQANSNPSFAPSQLTGDKKGFIASLLPKAMEISQQTGIDPKIILAQAAHESAWGSRAVGNNLFGIKGAGDSGTQNLATHESVNGKMIGIHDNFARYSSPSASLDGYADFMTKNSRYKPMLAAKGFDAQLAALGRSGYATDPNYTQKIAAIASGLDMPQDVAPMRPVQVASNDPQQSFAMNPVAQQPIPAPQISPASLQPQPEQQVTQAQHTPEIKPLAASLGNDPQSQLNALMSLSNNRYLTPAHRAIVDARIQQIMQQQDPMHQLQMQQAQMGVDKSALDLQYARDPNSQPLNKIDQLKFDQMKAPRVEQVGSSLVQINPDHTIKPLYSAPSASAGTEITDVDGRRVLIDKSSGNVVKELGGSPVKNQTAPSGYRETADGKGIERIPGFRDANLEMDMRKEFDGQSKDFRAVRDSYNRIQASSENPSPAGDLSLIFNYMKMLDPGSVVRESEFSTAANAAPLLTRIGLDPEKYKSVWEGQRLTPEQRADFLTRANQLYAEQDQTFQSLADQYTETAKRNGLDPSNIILTPRSNPRKKKQPINLGGYQIEEAE